ncbi:MULTISPECIES: HAD family hydrolase [Tissierellales]|jgi:HAD superfamily hydrolase (TIGR01509 family)|uniref:HAD family phosphatase n=1 Tax=Acidilutibacter cellobiosedens TaxID=2507161 RepID=A0A410QBE3_9FIRM|nr:MULTISPECIES: HAD family phosphatase [Tissierellales]MBE6081920.1 HAD family phosphatase [Tissierellaceae bacterium]QAT61277.1 HAD family phosphatase [Acidilutibacter cellobiosedens]SCL97108.1 Phosphorylated carbohydrates phosphatase [Sporanaerobacter sp. PP17-6a]
MDLLLTIFDMDGLMFDTERISYEAWKVAAEKYKFEISSETYEGLICKTEEDLLKELRYIYGEAAPINEWRNYMKKVRGEIIDKNKTVRKKKGLDSLINFLRNKDIKIAVASSSYRKTVEKYLKLENLTDHIDIIVSGDEVLNGKPNPEILLKACSKANVDTSKALVLEDSLPGIKAAKNAGINVFLVPDMVRNKEIESSADKVFNSLEEVRIYLSSVL